MERIKAFFRAAWAELGKVHYPSRQETVRMSLVVLAMLVVFSVFLGLSDLLLGRIMQGVVA